MFNWFAPISFSSLPFLSLAARAHSHTSLSRPAPPSDWAAKLSVPAGVSASERPGSLEAVGSLTLWREELWWSAVDTHYSGLNLPLSWSTVRIHVLDWTNNPEWHEIWAAWVTSNSSLFIETCDSTVLHFVSGLQTMQEPKWVRFNAASTKIAAIQRQWARKTGKTSQTSYLFWISLLCISSCNY